MERPVVSGNLAYDYSNYEEKQRYVKNKAKAAKREESRKVNLGVIIFYAVIIGAVAFCLIGREVKIYAKNSEIAALEKEMINLQAQSKQYKMEAEAALDLNEIEQTAVNDYNMKRPETHQIVYVNLQQEDVVQSGEYNEKPGLMQKVLGIISKW